MTTIDITDELRSMFAASDPKAIRDKAAALRAAASEAAWDGYEQGYDFGVIQHPHPSVEIPDKMTARYGPRPAKGPNDA